MLKPTPYTLTPWTYDGTGCIFDATGARVALIHNEQQGQRGPHAAAFLVQAVNERDVLIETLKTIRNMTDGHPVDADRRDRINQLCRKALVVADALAERTP